MAQQACDMNKKIEAMANFGAMRRGGHGAVREFIE
jgi:3-deoxy-D-manno-octulosonate 8-phosphate phosphatase KdsC-like HAD superfamily phosphatase